MKYPEYDKDKLKSMKKLELLKWIEDYKQEWNEWVTSNENEHTQEKNALREEDIFKNPEYVALQKKFDGIQIKYQEADRQRKDLADKLEVARSELRELRSRKPAGRPGLPTETVDRIVLLRSSGLSIRKIAAELNISKSVVAKYIDVLNINGQSQDNV